MRSRVGFELMSANVESEGCAGSLRLHTAGRLRRARGGAHILCWYRLRHTVVRKTALLLMLLVVELQTRTKQALAAGGDLSRSLVRAVPHTGRLISRLSRARTLGLLSVGGRCALGVHLGCSSSWGCFRV